MTYGRMDFPRYSKKFCTYTFMDDETKKTKVDVVDRSQEIWKLNASRTHVKSLHK